MVPSGGQHPAADAGLLLDLADRGVLGGLAVLEVTLRQRPEQPAAPVDPADQGHSRPAGAAVDHQAARRGLLDLAQPALRGRRLPRRGRRDEGGGPSVDRSQPSAGVAAARSGLGRRRTAVPFPLVPDVPAASAPLDLPAARRRLAAELVELTPLLDELAERFAAAGHSLALVGGSVRDALLGRPAPDLDFTTDARPEEVRDLLRAGPTRWWEVGIAFGTVGARKGGTCSRSRPTAPRSTATTRASPRCPTATPSRTTCAAATSPSTRWPWRCRRRRFVDPHGGLRRPGRRAAAHPGHAGGLVRRRPAADDAGRPVRRPARLRGRPGGRRGDDGDGRPDRDRLRRAGPRRADQAAAARPRPRPGSRCWSTPASPTTCCPSCRRCGWRSTSTTGTRTSTSTR